MEERKSLIDKLHNDKVDVNQTISLCVRILNEHHYCYDEAFLESEYSILGICFYEAYYSLIKEKNSINDFLYFCDLIITVLSNYNGRLHIREAEQVIKILKNALNILGYGIKMDERNCYKCYRLDLKSEIVASNQSKTVKEKIYEYLSLPKGNVSGKRETLKSIIDEIDTFCKNRTSIGSLEKTKQFYQCVRHPLDDPVREFPFYYKNEEKWLDFIFQMAVDVLAYKDLEDRTKSIKEQEKKGE